MDTAGVKLSELPLLETGLQNSDLIEVIRPRPERPGSYGSFRTFAAGNQIGQATIERIGTFRLATVAQTTDGTRSDRVVTAEGLTNVLIDMLENKILAGDNTTVVYDAGVLTISQDGA